MLRADEIEVRATPRAARKLRARHLAHHSPSPPAQRVGREIQILKLLKHPNVVRLWEILYTQKRIFLVMEFAARGELFQHIVRAGRLAEDEGRRFFGQIIAGVAYLHSQHVVHRDLKPENLLLDANRNILIADFGLSTRCAPGQVLKHSCGSPCYAAPEMLRVGQQMRYVGHPVDLWSCGVTLYAMLCGCLFEHANTSSLYKKIIAGNYSGRATSRATRATSSGGSSTPTRASGSPSADQSHAWSLANGGGAAGGRAAAGAAYAPRRDREPRLLGARLVVARTARTPRLRGGDDGGGARRGAPHRRHRLVLPPPSQGDPRRAKGAGGHGARARSLSAAARPGPPAAPRCPLGSRRQHERAARRRRRRRSRRRRRRAAARGTRVGHAASPRLARSPAGRDLVADAPDVVASLPQGAAGGRGARRRASPRGVKPSGGAYTPRGGDERSAAARLHEAQRQHLLANAQQRAVDRPRPPSARAPYRPTSAAAPPTARGTRRRAPRRRRRRRAGARRRAGRVGARAQHAPLRAVSRLPRVHARRWTARAHVCP